MKRTRSNTKEMLSQGFKFPTDRDPRTKLFRAFVAPFIREFVDFPLIVRGYHIEQAGI